MPLLTVRTAYLIVSLVSKWIVYTKFIIIGMPIFSDITKYNMQLNEITLYGPRERIIIPPPGTTGEVYCFPRRQLIFSFGGHVLYHSSLIFTFLSLKIKGDIL